MTEKKVTATVKYAQDSKVVSIKYSNGGVSFLPIEKVEAARKALNEWHRAEKASKPKERYYAAWANDTDDRSTYWVVRDSEKGDELRGRFDAMFCGDDARLFAKALNRQERKRLDSNTVTPGTDEAQASGLWIATIFDLIFS